jgi:nucleotide-binding universal stress UspA family protein
MPTQTFPKILVATDFSDGSDDALATAIDMAARLGSTLEIVHVVDLMHEQFPFGVPLPYLDTDAVIAFAERGLAERAARARRAGLTCETTILNGSPDVEIVRWAAEADAALIIVGTHGRTGLAHVVLGSVAERVVQHAGRPVLTVPFARKAA